MAIDYEYANVILPRIFDHFVAGDQITLIGGIDGQRIPINRFLLMANSKYFAAALSPHFNKNDETEFVFDETDGAMLKAIVDFCYTGVVDLTEENMLKLLAISDSVEMDLLNAKCRLFIHKKVTRSNALAIFTIADKYNYRELLGRALNLFTESFEERPESDTNGLDWRLWQTILKKNINLHVTQPLVFNRLVQWFRQNEAERGQHMIELLKLIRLESMPSQFLMDEQFVAIYKQFNCFESIIAEREKRETAEAESRSIYVLTEHRESIYVERYNNASNTFEDARTINVVGRLYYGVQLHKNKVYVMGGSYRNRAEILNSVSRFDLITGEEKILPGMIQARRCFASISLEKYIYVFGGFQMSEDSTLKSCERFDVEIMTWTKLKSMNVAYHNARTISLNGYIYVMGNNGTCGSDTLLEIYDPKNDEWHKLAIINGHMFDVSLVTYDSFLYAFLFESSCPVQRYDVSKNCWTKGNWNSVERADSRVETNTGNFVIMKYSFVFGKIYLDSNRNCSYQQLTKTRQRGEHFLFLN